MLEIYSTVVLCAGLSFDPITTKDFIKRAFLAIAYMDQDHPELRVDIGLEGITLIKPMDYSEAWDKEITELALSSYFSVSK